jgi:hypothetical protein
LATAFFVTVLVAATFLAAAFLTVEAFVVFLTVFLVGCLAIVIFRFI